MSSSANSLPAARNWKQYLRFGAVRSFLNKAHADRGLERYRRASISASTSVLSKALTIVISFVSVPLTVHYLGAERYGVWLTISSLLTWMALTDFGIAGYALVNVIADADGRDDRKLAQEFASSAFWALTGLSAVFGIALAASFNFIPWRDIFRASMDVSTAELNLACALTLGVFVVNLPLNMLNSIYSAYQDGFVSNIWSMVSNVVALIGLIIVSQYRGGLPALIIGTFATRAFITIINGGYLFISRYPWLRPAPSAVRWTRITRLLSLGGKYMITQLANLGIYQSQPFMITQLLGPSKVATFVIAYKIIAVPIDLAYIATAPLVSAFAEARARMDWRWIRNALKNSTLGCIAIGIPATLVIALAGKWLVRILGGPSVVPDWSVIAWLSVYTLIGMAMMTAGQALCGLERVGLLAISLSMSAVFTVTLGILFAKPWGLAGIAAGMAVAKVVTYLPLQGYQIARIMKIPDQPEQVAPAQTATV
jgi:O-antigen/teichoic acid export membrane protein